MAEEPRRLIPDDEVHRHTDDLFGPGGLFPRHGPYGPGRTEAAADLLVGLARYLNYATQAADGVPWPATVGRVWSGLAATLATVEQALRQSSSRLDVLARDERAYVDQVGTVGGDNLAPTGAALAARTRLLEALGPLADAVTELRAAARYAGRIGLRDDNPVAEVAGRDDRD